jgi:ribosome-associated toxin RatA of RatAB toxin-antitoxin module
MRMDRRHALKAAVALAAAGVAPWARAALDMQIAVGRRGEQMMVDAAFVAPVTQSEAWEVLTDFDAMASFVPNLEESRVAARDGARLRVEQRGVARWGPLTHAFSTVREVELEPMTQVRSQSIAGSLRNVRSSTHFTPLAAGTEIRHHLEFAADTWMPAVLVEPFLRHEVREQFEAVVAEMLRRRAAVK